MPHPLTPTELAELEPYRKHLPNSDYATLEAWASTFWPFQRGWLFDNSRYAAQNKGRQMGYSHTTAGKLVIWGAFHGETTTVISVGERESIEVLDKCKKHSNVLVALGSSMARMVRSPATEIHFASGGRIIALPSTGGRSFTGNVYLDEFAYYENPKKIWDAALAITMLGFRARVSSTPNGSGNLFHELMTDPSVSRNARRSWKLYETPIEVAIADGYPVDIDDCWLLAKNDPRLFDQLFRCRFLDNQLQYIPSEFLRSATEAYGKGPPEHDDAEHYAGLDIGLERDLLVLIIFRVLPDGTRWVVHMESYRGAVDDLLIDQLIEKAFSPAGWNCRRMCADATGLGAVPAKRAARIYGQRFEPITFTLKSKEELATGLYAVASSGQLRMPRSYEYNGKDEAPLLRDAICAIKRVVSEKTGNVRYDAPRNSTGHADHAWAAALGLHACERPSTADDAVLVSY